MKQASGCSDRSSGGFDEAWEVYQSKITSLSQLRHNAVTSAGHVLVWGFPSVDPRFEQQAAWRLQGFDEIGHRAGYQEAPTDFRH